jgi:predicted enzyme related to lactoylglutathione lyase
MFRGKLNAINIAIHYSLKKRNNKSDKLDSKMHKPLLTLILVTALLSCNTETKKANIMDGPKDQPESENSVNDTTPRVTGIGGIFFFSDDPAALKDWYAGKLGLETNEWGSSFEFRNANRPDEINYLQWSPFTTGSEYFSPSKKEFMINYRVQNIEGLVSKLRAGGVTILDSIETFDYGKFVHILDPEGNKIELWEPVDSVFTAMGGKTTK